MRKKVISVIGGHSCSKEVEQIAHELGKKLAKVVDTLVSGGLGGTMRAVCQGFKANGGLTIGIIASYNKNDANQFVDIALPTGLEAGTLSEIAYCLQFGIPVINLESWDIPGVIKVKTVDEAIVRVKETLGKSKAQNSNAQR